MDSSDPIIHKLDEISNSLTSLTDRVSKLEVSNNNNKTSDNHDNIHIVENENVARGACATEVCTTFSPYDSTLGASSDILRDFDCIKDSLSRITIPNKFKVNDSPRGIGKESKTALSVLSKCARFAETGLKVIAALQPENEDDHVITIHKDDIQKLFTVFAGQINYLQGEYANLVVRSTFDDETSRLFRQFENNTGAFSDSSLQNIRLAAELANSRQTSNQNNRPRGRGNWNFNFRPRGNFRGYHPSPHSRSGFPSSRPREYSDEP